MALSKAVSTPVGVQATYWRIIAAEVQHDAQSIGVWLAGYASESARRAGAQPLAARHITVPATAMPGHTMHEVRTADLYVALTAILNAPRPSVPIGNDVTGTPAPDPLAGSVPA